MGDTCSVERGLGLAGRVEGLGLRAATDVLAVDENVGHSRLAGLGLQVVLDVGTVGDLVELDDLGIDIAGLEQVLGLLGEGAVALGEDHDLVAGDVGVS
mgnify:CR=1 FL=1